MKKSRTFGSYIVMILIAIGSFSFKNKEIPSHNSELTSKTESSNSESSSEKNTDKASKLTRNLLYKGTLNGTIKISMYLKEQENPCGGDLTFFIGMYKYDNHDKWILLDVSTDSEKENFCMVEADFSGVLFLKENDSFFNGTWISPNAEKQLKVELENVALKQGVALDTSIIEKLDEILFDDLIYNKNDC